MRSLFKITFPPVRALALGLALALVTVAPAEASTSSPMVAHGSAPVFLAETSVGWFQNLLAARQASSAGSFDRQSVLTLLLTALAAIAVVRVAEHRNRPGQDR